MLRSKKRELVCPHADCFFYSSEPAEVDGEWIHITYCSHPNSDLIDSGKSCNFYRLDWAKQLQKVGKKSQPSDRVKLERQALVKLLQNGVGYLAPDERDAVLSLLDQLKLQEERLAKLSEVLDDFNGNGNGLDEDPFVIEEPASPPSYSSMQPVNKSPNGNTQNGFSKTLTPESVPEPVDTEFKEEWVEAPVSVKKIEEKPKEPSPEDVVREFLEAWNTQSFDKEYNCLGRKLRTISKDDYIQSRSYAYSEALKHRKNGDSPTQELGQIHSAKIDGKTARIICDKLEHNGRFTKTYQQRYVLENNNGSWHIVQVQTRER